MRERRSARGGREPQPAREGISDPIGSRPSPCGKVGPPRGGSRAREGSNQQQVGHAHGQCSARILHRRRARGAGLSSKGSADPVDAQTTKRNKPKGATTPALRDTEGRNTDGHAGKSSRSRLDQRAAGNLQRETERGVALTRGRGNGEEERGTGGLRSRPKRRRRAGFSTTAGQSQATGRGWRSSRERRRASFRTEGSERLSNNQETGRGTAVS